MSWSSTCPECPARLGPTQGLGQTVPDQEPAGRERGRLRRGPGPRQPRSHRGLNLRAIGGSRSGTAETVRPISSRRAFRDDATLSSPLVPDRRALDDEPAVGDAYLQGGVVQNEGPHEGMMTVAYKASTGAELWESNIEVGQSYFGGLAVSANSDELYVTGTHYHGRGIDILTVAYETRSGAKLWTAHFEQSTHLMSGAGALVDIGNTVVVTGSAGRSLAIVAYDASTGTQLWTTRYGPDGSPEPTGAIASPDGRMLYVLATRYANTVVIAFRTGDGNRLWVARQRRVSPAGMAFSARNRRLYVTGEDSSRWPSRPARARRYGPPATSGRRVVQMRAPESSPTPAENSCT